MTICEEILREIYYARYTTRDILREIYRQIREEGYHPNLRGMQEIHFSPDGYTEFRAEIDPLLYYIAADREEDNFDGIPVKINRRQEAKFRVICKPTDN